MSSIINVGFAEFVTVLPNVTSILTSNICQGCYISRSNIYTLIMQCHLFADIQHLGVVLQVHVDMGMERRWKELGEVLGVVGLDDIEVNYGYPQRCLIAMLSSWLRRHYQLQQSTGPPSWQTLAKMQLQILVEDAASS